MFDKFPYKNEIALLAVGASFGSLATAYALGRGRPPHAKAEIAPAKFIMPPGNPDSNNYKDGTWSLSYMNRHNGIVSYFTIKCAGHTLIEQVVNLKSTQVAGEDNAKPHEHIDSSNKVLVWDNNSWCQDGVFTDGDLNTPFNPNPVPPRETSTGTILS